MAEMVDLSAKIKRYYKFSPLEIRNLAIITLVFGFILSMDEWGPGSQFEFFTGIFNLFNACLVVAFSLLVYHSAQRIAGLQVGYRVEYRLWTFGLFLALIAAFVSSALGKTWWVLLPGGIMIHHLAKHRIGFFRYGLGYFAHGMIAFSGVIACLLLVVIFKIIGSFIAAHLITKLINFNLAFALWQILPLPETDGLKLFFGSRMVYALGFSTVLAAVILLSVDIPVWIAVLGSLLIGIICWLLYYIFIERFLWRGA